jgi:hypothetical protein
MGKIGRFGVGCFGCGVSTRLRSAVGALVLSAVLMVVTQMAVAAEQAVDFDIPVQPLAAALDAFSAVTGATAVYNGNLAAGLLSHGLRGRLTPREALAVMLRDTGLVAEYTASDAFVVLAGTPDAIVVRTASAIASAALSQQDASERRYSALLQDTINRALCAQPETRPGRYRAALRFWVSPAGAVTHFRLLNQTGDDRRDAAITAVAGRASVGEAPPARMAQPFTMVVLPQMSEEAVCPSAEGR